MSRPVSVWKVSPSGWVGSPVRVNSPRWCPSWWKVHRARRLVVSVGPPSRQCRRWWISRWWVEAQPGKRQPRSRSRTRTRVRCGTTRWARPTLTGCPSVSQTGVRCPVAGQLVRDVLGQAGAAGEPATVGVEVDLHPVLRPRPAGRSTRTARTGTARRRGVVAASRERVASTIRASAQVTRGRPPSVRSGRVQHVPVEGLLLLVAHTAVSVAGGVVGQGVEEMVLGLGEG